ncbi:unnamed protein product [Ceutorhynchus assimilis]|uniref:FP protein C-terminal domain-containing protein n=1 Tax=Ceutorhynchus assimilis TaxID=467358 RepID=A0A9N9MNP9_9CUCU|nr:unnamed protein product [Ceutorhynchus assimilis]
MAGNRKKKSLTGPKCKGNVTKTQNKIQCAGGCKEWFHKSCSGLTDEEFTAFELLRTDEKWCCVTCSINLETSDLEPEESDEPLVPVRSQRLSTATVCFKYVWCKDDNILARKTEGAPVIRIITSGQVDSLKTNV